MRFHYFQFILIVFFSFKSQAQEKFHKVDAFMDSLIQGEWHLYKTIVYDGYDYEGVQKMYSKNNIGRVIRFEKDSLFVFGDSTVEFDVLKRKFDYKFNIYKDTNFDLPLINVYRNYIKPKNKQFNIAKYNIIKLNESELIIQTSSSNRIGFLKGLDINENTIHYIYRRKGVDELLDKLEGTWYSACVIENDTNFLVFTRKPPVTSNYIYTKTYNFSEINEMNYCEYFTDYGGTGYVGGSEFVVDVKLNCFYFLYLNNTKSCCYYIHSIDAEKMILSKNEP